MIVRVDRDASRRSRRAEKTSRAPIGAQTTIDRRIGDRRDERTNARRRNSRAAAPLPKPRTVWTYPLGVHGAVDLAQRLGAALERLRVERRRHRLLVILRALRHRDGGGDGGRPEREARAVRGHRVAKHRWREVCVRVPVRLRRERVAFRQMCTQSRLPGGAPGFGARR